VTPAPQPQGTSKRGGAKSATKVSTFGQILGVAVLLFGAWSFISLLVGFFKGPSVTGGHPPVKTGAEAYFDAKIAAEYGFTVADLKESPDDMTPFQSSEDEVRNKAVRLRSRREAILNGAAEKYDLSVNELKDYLGPEAIRYKADQVMEAAQRLQLNTRVAQKQAELNRASSSVSAIPSSDPSVNWTFAAAYSSSSATSKTAFKLITGAAELNRRANQRAETPSFLSSLGTDKPPPTLPPESSDQLPPDENGFVLVEASTRGTEAVHPGRNTIFMREDETSKIDLASLGPFMAVNAAFRDSFHINALEHSPPPPNTWFFTTARGPDGSEIVTIYDDVASEKANYLVGRAFVVSSDKERYKKLFSRLMASTLKGSTLFVMGDDLTSIDLKREAESNGITLLRRSARIKTPLLEAASRLAQRIERPFDTETTVFINGLPSNEDQVAKIGQPPSTATEWVKARDSFSAIITENNWKAASSAEEFKKILVDGKEDIVALVAHSANGKMYLGGEVVSLEDIRQLPRRRNNSRPRIAVLLSCQTGKLQPTIPTPRAAWLRRKAVESFGELLVTKGYFDLVLAPNENIDPTESRVALETVIFTKPVTEFASSFVQALGPSMRDWTKIATYKKLWRTEANG
jgi:hypothetical protein